MEHHRRRPAGREGQLALFDDDDQAGGEAAANGDGRAVEPGGERRMVLWHGAPSSQAEAEALAAEARRLRPDARIMIRPPAGPLYDWE